MRSIPPRPRRVPASPQPPAPEPAAEQADAPLTPIPRIFDAVLLQTRCFGLQRINCPAAAGGAFFEAARAVASGAPVRAKDALAQYYGGLIPESAADVLDLSVSHEMGNYPPMAAVLPWMRCSPDEYLQALETGTRGYQLQHGQGSWGVTDGHTQFGPVSLRKLWYEVHRLGELIGRVREHGIDDTCPPVLGGLVIDDRDEHVEVLDVRDGLHRCAVFAALGHETVRAQVPAELSEEVRRSESATWHHVESGLFTETEALEIFDKYVVGVL